MRPPKTATSSEERRAWLIQALERLRSDRDPARDILILLDLGMINDWHAAMEERS